ncbi:hypothetical protein K490DRAFT_35485 [Saccharata proteae CBS 121410]|uniref:Cenp-O kinetochore centromere component n=1 Tax=Saccharata proteae CBS 121410 TaxID=1314787 RepID=A0A9P4HZ74_9PEZI|nr:hypothetical protein K490DRAFT_35485 [Saccharata proteae CBS 121410]
MREQSEQELQSTNHVAHLTLQPVSKLETRRSVLSTTLLSSRNTLTRLQRAKSKSPSASTALAVAQNQHNHNLENLHRTCAGVTAFRVKDPDPFAVDNGKILGVRIDVSVNGVFVPPYYLLLNRASPESPSLRIHKHTIPPCVGLAELEARYLPRRNAVEGVDAPLKPAPEQNLQKLVRVLRRELVGHHLRVSAVEKLRGDAGLSGKEGSESDDEEEEEGGKAGITGIAALDIDGREIEIKWADGTSGRVWISKAGVVEKAVVKAVETGARRRDLERKILGGDRRVEGLVDRLAS